jgi:hypothetical protein
MTEIWGHAALWLGLALVAANAWFLLKHLLTAHT